MLINYIFESTPDDAHAWCFLALQLTTTGLDLQIVTIWYTAVIRWLL